MKQEFELRELMLAGIALFVVFIVMNVLYRMYDVNLLSQLPLEGDSLRRLRELLQVTL